MALFRPHPLAARAFLAVRPIAPPATAEASRRALREMTCSPALEQLTALSLRGGSLAGDRATVLFTAPLENVRELHIVGCELGGPAAQALAAATHLRRLTRLNLAHNR